MYHHDLGKSTLELWGEERDATESRRKALAKCASVLKLLEQQKRLDQPDDDKENQR